MAVTPAISSSQYTAATGTAPTIAGVGGLASGIDTTSIINALVAAAGASTTQLQNKAQTLQTRADLLRSFNSKLLTTKLDLLQLRKTSTYATPTATSSNTAAVTATASSTALPGSFQITVDKIATAQQILTAGVSDPNLNLGTGSISVQVGNNAATTINVDSNNSSLTGLADSINQANIGITASVINDGSNTPYHLSLTSKSTGAASAITLDMSGLSGGVSDEAKGVTAASSSTNTAAVSLAGTSATGKLYQVQTTSDGASGFNYAVRSSSDDGATWGSYSTAAPVTGSAVTLESGVTMKLDSTKLQDGDLFTLSPVRQISAAQDASIQYGSGTKPLTVTSSTNNIGNLIPGVTLNLAGQSTGPVTVTIGTNSGSAKDLLNTFITDYNTLADFWKTNGSYDSTTGVAGPLFGETSIKQNLDNIVSSLTGSVPGIGSLNSLQQVGITWDNTTGHLTLNDTTFDAQMAASPNAVANVFANSGTSSSSLVQFVTVGTKTNIDRPFSVAISRPASQAVLSSTPLSTTITSDANTLHVTLNGLAKTVTLAAGVYNQQTLAAQVQSAINTAFNTPSTAISASVVNGQMQLRSTGFGSSQTIAIDDSGAGAQLGFTATSSASGVDVAGTINGTPATGLGQVLQGAIGSSAEGLVLLSTTTNPMSGVTITGHKGIIQQVDSAIQFMTDSTIGTVSNETDNLLQQITDINSQVTKQNDSLAVRKQRLQEQFAAMETTISNFNGIGNMLNIQLNGTSTSSSSSTKKA